MYVMGARKIKDAQDFKNFINLLIKEEKDKVEETGVFYES